MGTKPNLNPRPITYFISNSLLCLPFSIFRSPHPVALFSNIQHRVVSLAAAFVSSRYDPLCEETKTAVWETRHRAEYVNKNT